MDASRVSFQSYMFGGSISQVEILRVGVPDVSKPFLREAGNFHLIVCCHAAVGFMTRWFLSLSSPLQCGIFLIHCLCRSCSASFWISFRGNCFLCCCRFGVSVISGPSYVTILNLKISRIYFLDDFLDLRK